MSPLTSKAKTTYSKQSIQSLEGDLEDPNIAPNGIEAPLHPSISLKRSSETSDTLSASEKRDEVQEIRNRSRNEDRRVQLWSSVLLLLILIVGATVSSLTYHFLREEESKALNIAVGRSDAKKCGIHLSIIHTHVFTSGDSTISSLSHWLMQPLSSNEMFVRHFIRLRV